MAAGTGAGEFVAPIDVPARAFEYDEEERPEGGDTGCDYYDVAFIPVEYLGS